MSCLGLHHLPPSLQIFVSLVLVSMALSLGFWFKVREFKARHYYVSSRYLYSVAAETFFIFWGFLILLSVMVPMAMFIMWVRPPPPAPSLPAGVGAGS